MRKAAVIGLVGCPGSTAVIWLNFTSSAPAGSKSADPTFNSLVWW